MTSCLPFPECGHEMVRHPGVTAAIPTAVPRHTEQGHGAAALLWRVDAEQPRLPYAAEPATIRIVSGQSRCGFTQLHAPRRHYPGCNGLRYRLQFRCLVGGVPASFRSDHFPAASDLRA